MGKLKDLFEERTRMFVGYSDRILKQAENNVIPAVLEMLDLNDNELEKLEWTNVQMNDDHLVLNGVIAYKEGDVITDGDMTVTLDAAMALLLDKIIRVGIPMELAENGSKVDVLDHLMESQRQLKDEYEAVYGHEPPTMEEAMEQALREELGMNFDFGPDFDYNDLSEEQKEALHTTMLGDTGEKLN